MPPSRPPSNIPKKKRAATSPPKDLVKPRKVLTSPQQMSRKGRYLPALKCLTIQFEGTSTSMYGT